MVGLAALGLTGLAAVAGAQTNIDQGKSPADIFANDCGACHKSVRGLAAGKNSLMLTSFLREHYTASREQAAALAAYVLGNGGNAPVASAPGPKSGRAALEEPKSSGPRITEPRTTEPKLGEPKLGEPRPAESKPALHPTRAASRPAEEPPAGAKPQRPVGEASRPATVDREQKQEPESVRPAPVVAAPAPAEASPAAAAAGSERSPTTSAAAPVEAQPSETTPVPRDNIPD